MPDYVPDLTCIVRRKRRWFDPRNMGESTVICGRATVEQYLRCGYAFDWPATDNARAKAMEARQGRDGEAGSVHDSAAPQGFAQPTGSIKGGDRG